MKLKDLSMDLFENDDVLLTVSMNHFKNDDCFERFIDDSFFETMTC